MSAPAEQEQARPRLGRMALALLLGLGLGLGLSRLLWPETGTETGMPLAADPEWGKRGAALDPDAAGSAPRNGVILRPGGLSPETAADRIFSLDGWMLWVDFADPRQIPDPASLSVELQSGGRTRSLSPSTWRRTESGFAGPIDPRALGLDPGPLSIRIGSGRGTGRGTGSEPMAELRILSCERQGEPPLGPGTTLHFDFGVDRDGDGAPDFLRDLETFGLASSERPELADRVARRVAERALDRVRRAYAGPLDPEDGRPIAPARVDLRLGDPGSGLGSGPGGSATRICVGGADPSGGATVGNVHFDPFDREGASTECGDLPPTGLFPRALDRYRDDPLFRETFGSLRARDGGLPVGRHPFDAAILEALEGQPIEMEGAAPNEPARLRVRGEILEQAIEIFAHALGTVMAHEAAHTLGLVVPPSGQDARPERGSRADPMHRPASAREPEAGPWLMSPGPRLSFPELAGRGGRGEIVFHPLALAYLRDEILTGVPRCDGFD